MRYRLAKCENHHKSIEAKLRDFSFWFASFAWFHLNIEFLLCEVDLELCVWPLRMKIFGLDLHSFYLISSQTFAYAGDLRLSWKSPCHWISKDCGLTFKHHIRLLCFQKRQCRRPNIKIHLPSSRCICGSILTDKMSFQFCLFVCLVGCWSILFYYLNLS